MTQGASRKIDTESEPRLKLGRLGEFVGFRMRRVQNQFSADFAAASAEFGMRSGLFSSLAIIAANPGMSQQELSSVVGLDKSVAVQIVDDLEARGLAKRERSTIDRRRHSLNVTVEGEAFLETMFARVGEVEGKVLRQFTPGERAELSGMLDRMYAILTR